MANALRDPLTPESAVEDVFGMKPGLHRASILPYRTDDQGDPHWAAPQFVYDAAKAFVTPGVAAQGGRVTTDDALNVALNITGGGTFAPKPKGAVLGAGGARPPRPLRPRSRPAGCWGGCVRRRSRGRPTAPRPRY